MRKNSNIGIGEVKDNSKRAKIVIIVFCVLISLISVSIVSGYFELTLLKNAYLKHYIEEDQAHNNDLRQRVIGVLQSIMHTLSIVVFLLWFRRAYANLHRLEIDYLRYRESMAIWSWFIPLIVLFFPFQIMTEIWKETQKSIQKYNPTYKFKSGKILIGVWWGLFIISNFISHFVLKTFFEKDNLEQLIAGSQAILISDIIQLPEAILLVLIVHKLSKMESKLAYELNSTYE